jgi:SAM-dependent methyltransferase
MHDRAAPPPASPRLYADLASWWPLLDPVAAYADEAGFYRRTLESACDGVVRTLLELGSGGGNNASHLKRHFGLTLVDASPQMLEVSRAQNPECEHAQGDMRTARLGRTFDVVLIHDAIGYMTTPADLRAALETAFVHLRPGGAALFAPDYVRETFTPETSHGGHDGATRALRYLEWVWDPDPSDTSYTVDYAFVLREGTGSVRQAHGNGGDGNGGDGRGGDGHSSVRVEHDRHLLGVFPRDEWLRLMGDVGFGDVVRLPHRDPGIDRELDVFVGRRM